MRTTLLRDRGEPALRQYRPPPAQCHRKAWAARFRTAAQFVQTEAADRPMTCGCPARNTFGVPRSSTPFASRAHGVPREPTRDLIRRCILAGHKPIELMSPRLPKSASPIQIAEPVQRERESNKRYCDLVVLTRDGEHGFDIQRVEKDSRFHGLTGELTGPGILIVARLKKA